MDAYQKQLLAQSVATAGATAGATAAFSAVPFVGPILGPTMGGIVGSQVGKLFSSKKKEPKVPLDIRAGSQGMDFKNGGFLPIGKNKVLVKGNNHNDSNASGVKIGNIEVEGGEVITKMALGGSLGNQFVFSKRLKNSGTGKSFADTAKDTKSEKDLLKLAVKQEAIKKSSSESKILSNGGKMKYQVGGLLPYGAAALNIGMGLFGKQQTTNLPDVDTRAVDRMETNVNIQPQLQEIRNAQQTANVASGNNLNAALASQAGATNAISKLYSDKINQEAQLKTQKTNAYLGLAAQQRQIQAQRAQEELAAKQARVNMLTQGLMQAGSTYLNQKAEANKQLKERAGLELQARLIPDKNTQKAALVDIAKLYDKKPTAFQTFMANRSLEKARKSDKLKESTPIFEDIVIPEVDNMLEGKINYKSLVPSFDASKNMKVNLGFNTKPVTKLTLPKVEASSVSGIAGEKAVSPSKLSYSDLKRGSYEKQLETSYSENKKERQAKENRSIQEEQRMLEALRQEELIKGSKKRKEDMTSVAKKTAKRIGTGFSYTPVFKPVSPKKSILNK